MRLLQRPKVATCARFRKTRLLIVGCGDVGLRVANHLNGRLRLFGTTRSSTKKANISANNAQPLVLDLTNPMAVLRAARLSTRIIMLAPPPNLGPSDPHSKQLLHAICKVHAQRKITGALPAKPRVVYVSTTGVYGDTGGVLIDETAPLNPTTDRAKRRVSGENFWRVAARKNQITITVLRAPGIYALERLPIDRLKAQTPALIDTEDVYTNHIHADDLARLCIRSALLADGKLAHRVFNAVDQSHLKMGDYFDLVANHFSLARPPRLPREQLALQVSTMMLSFMSESRNINGERVLRDFAMQLRYRTVASFLQSLK